MIESIVLIEGKNIKNETLMISLSNAKQLVVGSIPGFGVILHVAATSSTDLGNALLAFSKVPDVTGVLTLALRSPE
ncbi:MAG TPA: hypothetical protein VGQ53_00405 [Chitinophagaceae bacterium]|jgi:hypothetical protein|nr:hypothetical protein [Chitinophagaceae bacterium]